MTEATFREPLLRHPLLQAVPASDRDAVAAAFAFRLLPAGEPVVRAGEPSDGVYVLLAGRCSVVRDDVTVGEVPAGSVIGEAGVLAGTARNATVRTMRDSVVAFLGLDALEALAGAAPAVWRALGASAARRQLGLPAEGDRTTLSLTLYPVGAPEPGDLVERMHTALSALGRCAVLRYRPGEPTGPEAVARAQRVEEDHDYVLYVADDEADRDWNRLCVRQADRVLFVVDGAHPPDPKQTTSIVTSVRAEPEVTRHLLLLQPAECTVARDTAKWLGLLAVTSHHHVRRGHAEDAARAARLVVGRGVGVSFSGAATRGFGHLGVVRALHALDVPVDMAVGVSAGAPVAAFLGMGLSPDEATERYLRLAAGLIPPWWSYQPAFVSLLAGFRAERAIREAFGEVHLEDLLVPVHVTSTDLVRADRLVHHEGPLWRAVRASGSLPVYWPPVCTDGRVLVDGALTTNQPVDLLQRACGRGWMIASSMQAAALDTSLVPRDSMSVSGWRLLLQRLLRPSQPLGHPSLGRILVQSLTLASHQHEAAFRARHHGAPVTWLQPSITTHGGVFALSPTQGAQFAEAVREQVEPLLARDSHRVGGRQSGPPTDVGSP